ncbi:carbohydrate sulfotransferase [Plakobranchus ocellatus]|uniref:Carbohydrate sulfotransferase n=1 Tax=Plakobranchus ocellatus TaxID=259542 RepID=A0AAV4DHG7_9GAST|nr:carbohydrate sulfotransferase [Plakobranchus ocellatus]
MRLSKELLAHMGTGSSQIFSRRREPSFQFVEEVLFQAVQEKSATAFRDTKLKNINSAWQTSDATFLSRRRRLTDICNTDPQAQSGGIKGVFTHEPSGIIYCFVPKAGCTFWKRVFMVANEEQTESSNLFNISRHAIHSAVKNGARFNVSEHDSRHFPIRFTVARDPFSRLLSAYLDKAYLPDFWSSEMLSIARKLKPGKEIAKEDFLRLHFDQMADRFDRQSWNTSTAGERSCGKYVTFAEFVNGSYGRLEPHWMPLSMICNPCKFNVTHLSYMETFTEDARALLTPLGLEGVLDHLDGDAQVEEELRMIVDYNFWKYKYSRHIQRCSTTHELAYRLWKNFQWRGYIDPDTIYIPLLRQDVDFVKENLRKQLASARIKGLKDRAKLKAAKADFKKKAFLTLSIDMFRKLESKYKLDFRFYGFEKSKEELRALIDPP